MVHHPGQPRQELRAETAQTHCSPAGFLSLAPFSFLYNPGLSAQRGTTHSGLGLPTSVVNQGDLKEAILHLSFLFPDDFNLLPTDTKLTSTLQ